MPGLQYIPYHGILNNALTCVLCVASYVFIMGIVFGVYTEAYSKYNMINLGGRDTLRIFPIFSM